AGGARRTLGLSHVQGDPEPLIAVEFDRLHLALAYRGRQALLHGDRYLTGARTLLARLVDDALNLLAQLRQRLRANTLYFSHLSTPEPEYSSPPVQCSAEAPSGGCCYHGEHFYWTGPMSDTSDFDEFDEKSKSQVKRELHALQELGERLTTLKPELLDR